MDSAASSENSAWSADTTHSVRMFRKDNLSTSLFTQALNRETCCTRGMTSLSTESTPLSDLESTLSHNDNMCGCLMRSASAPAVLVSTQVTSDTATAGPSDIQKSV